MQTAFPFGQADDIARIRDRLAARHGRLRMTERLEPLGQLVRSMLGSRTRDTQSWPAFERLTGRYPRWGDLADAAPEEIEAVIAGVTYADRKARQISRTMRIIRARRARFDLGFLREWPLGAALAWLESLPGVGPKVGAATLNFSTLDRRAFVADTHVLRLLRRYGSLDARADAWRANEMVLAATEGWSAFELIELFALVKVHGQTVCRFHAPRCRDCPLARDCRHARADRQKPRM